MKQGIRPGRGNLDSHQRHETRHQTGIEGTRLGQSSKPDDQDRDDQDRDDQDRDSQKSEISYKE